MPSRDPASRLRPATVRRLAFALWIGFALAVLATCSLNPNPPNPHANDPDPSMDPLVAAPDASDVDADAAEDP